jgi:hypothetical protein
MAFIRQFFNKHLFFSSIIILSVLFAIYLTLDYFGPSEINLKPDTAFGFSCLRAKDLVVQEYDKNGDLWVTRGMILYKLKKDDNKFIRVAHVPTGLSIFWLRNFSILRRLTLRPECVEMVVTDKGDICALSAGRMWLLPTGRKKFKETLKLSHYGYGDQGIRNDGIIDINDSTVFFGEYFGNLSGDKVRVLKSKNNMSDWLEVFEFKPGQIQHIHAIQKDPYTEKLWILTGDKDEESMVAWSDNEFKSIVAIGNGNQLWRVCQLVFTEKEIYWGTDTYAGDFAGIYRWDKKTAEIEKLGKVSGRVFFATKLANGTIVMSTDREGSKDESDKLTRLFIIAEDNKIKSFDCGTWNHNKKGFWFKFAMLRFQRDQGGPALAITCLNQKELPDGELIIISEEELLAAAKAK